MKEIMNNFYGIQRYEDETDFEFCLRVCRAKHLKEIDCDWTDIVEHFDFLGDIHRDTLRKNFVGAMNVHNVCEYYEQKLKELATNEKSEAYVEDTLRELEVKQQELKKERYKLNDERSRLNALLRTEARWEVVIETLKDCVEAYKHEPSDYIVYKKYDGSKNEACLLLSDWHIGNCTSTFHNKFDLDIAKSRVERLTKDVIEYCALHQVKTLYVEILGDMISGNIHLTGRLSNNENVIEQTVETSEMLGRMIKELSKSIPNIKLVYCIGNHGRVSANIKESVHEENFEYLIRWYLTEKLKELHNIEWEYNVINKEICSFTLDSGRTIACAHGHKEKNYKEAVSKLTQYLGVVKVDEVHLGHFHNPQVINNVVVNGSLSGVDDYAQDLRFNESASQTLRVYDDKGNFITYQINLQ